MPVRPVARPVFGALRGIALRLGAGPVDCPRSRPMRRTCLRATRLMGRAALLRGPALARRGSVPRLPAGVLWTLRCATPEVAQ